MTQLFQLTPDRADSGILTRDHHRTRCIDRRDRHAIDQQRQHLSLAGRHRDHRPTQRQGLHQFATSSNQRRSILKRQHASHISCRKLTNGMTNHKIRCDTPTLKQRV